MARSNKAAAKIKRRIPGPMGKTFAIILFLACIFCSTALLAVSGRDVGVRNLDSLVNIYEPVRFDHALHTQIAENCWQCHHEHSKNASSCGDCHSLKAQDFKRTAVNPFMPCRNCHGAYDPAVPAMPGLKAAYHRQCFNCHRGMEEVGIDPKGCTNQCHAKKG